MKKLRMGMMGAGFIARPNGEALIAQQAVALVAISNPTIAKAQKVAADLGIKCAIYGNYDDMLTSERLDAVLINLPHHLHRDAFVKCAQSGLDVIVEKALANTYAQCVDMMNAAEMYGIKATVCHTQRYHAVLIAADEFIASHDTGPLLSVTDNIHADYFWDGRSPWQLSNEQSGGGIALNYGVHQLDRVHFFLRQKTVRFHAKYLSAKPGYSIPSSYAMMGVGDCGTPYAITCTGYSGPATNEMRLVFERGMLHCVLDSNGLMDYGLYWGDNESGVFQPQPVTLKNDAAYYERQMHAAVDYLSGVTHKPPIPLGWGAEMVRLVELGFDSQSQPGV